MDPYYGLDPRGRYRYESDVVEHKSGPAPPDKPGMPAAMSEDKPRIRRPSTTRPPRMVRRNQSTTNLAVALIVGGVVGFGLLLGLFFL